MTLEIMIIFVWDLYNTEILYIYFFVIYFLVKSEPDWNEIGIIEKMKETSQHVVNVVLGWRHRAHAILFCCASQLTPRGDRVHAFLLAFFFSSFFFLLATDLPSLSFNSLFSTLIFLPKTFYFYSFNWSYLGIIVKDFGDLYLCFSLRF